MLALFAIAIALPASAQDFFPAPRDFVIDKACDATRAIRSKSDATPLEVGKSYPARGTNKPNNPTHAFIRVEGREKWVDLDCGHFADAGSPARPAPGAETRPSGGALAPQLGCLPFFDTVDNPEPLGFGGRVDITPPPPALNAFDQAVNAACGAPGKVVSPDEFKRMMRGQGAVLERIKAFTGGKVYANRPAAASTDAYLEDLTDAWFEIGGFDHIFCGEPKPNKVDGLHFAGRYLQLQQSGDACRIENFRKNEVVPGVIYTMGARMRTASGRFARSEVKGYGLTMSAEDILKIATRAFSENPTSSSSSKGCVLSVTDDGKQFKTVFVRRRSGIRTFFPDATPNQGGQEDPFCAAPIASRD